MPETFVCVPQEQYKKLNGEHRLPDKALGVLDIFHAIEENIPDNMKVTVFKAAVQAAYGRMYWD